MNIIKHNFGSYRGFVTHLGTLAAAVVGRYGNPSQVDWIRVQRLVFVCKGNVCRSPYAQVRAIGLNVPSSSFGLHTTGQTPANAAAQRIASVRGVDLAAHRSTLFEASKIQQGDLLVAFEPGHLKMLQAAGTNAQTTLLGMWLARSARPYIADPYGKSDEYFRTCFELIDSGVEEMARSYLRAARVDSRLGRGAGHASQS